MPDADPHIPVWHSFLVVGAYVLAAGVFFFAADWATPHWERFKEERGIKVGCR